MLFRPDTWQLRALIRPIDGPIYILDQPINFRLLRHRRVVVAVFRAVLQTKIAGAPRRDCEKGHLRQLATAPRSGGGGTAARRGKPWSE